MRIMEAEQKQEEQAMSKILIAYYSRADENYFGGAMRYVKVGNTEIVSATRRSSATS